MMLRRAALRIVQIYENVVGTAEAVVGGANGAGPPAATTQPKRCCSVAPSARPSMRGQTDRGMVAPQQMLRLSAGALRVNAMRRDTASARRRGLCLPLVAGDALPVLYSQTSSKHQPSY
jgi:hypothetical protein